MSYWKQERKSLWISWCCLTLLYHGNCRYAESLEKSLLICKQKCHVCKRIKREAVLLTSAWLFFVSLRSSLSLGISTESSDIPDSCVSWLWELEALDMVTALEGDRNCCDWTSNCSQDADSELSTKFKVAVPLWQLPWQEDLDTVLRWPRIPSSCEHSFLVYVLSVVWRPEEEDDKLWRGLFTVLCTALSLLSLSLLRTTVSYFLGSFLTGALELWEPADADESNCKQHQKIYFPDRIPLRLKEGRPSSDSEESVIAFWWHRRFHASTWVNFDLYPLTHHKSAPWPRSQDVH